MTTLDNTDYDLIVELARCTLAEKAGRNNWVEEKAVDGLPEYICRIARGVKRSGKTVSQAIAIAVGRAKEWAAGGGDVSADTRAKAAKAVAEWESKKRAAKADNLVKATFDFDDEADEAFTLALSVGIEEAVDSYSVSDRVLELAAKVPCGEKMHADLSDVVSLASVASTYGASHAGGRPTKSGALGGKAKLHNAFPKPKKPKKQKQATAFPTPAQNRANLKRALRLAYELGYVENPDTVELSDAEQFLAKVRNAKKGKGAAVTEGEEKHCTCNKNDKDKECSCKDENVDKKPAKKASFLS